MGKKNRRKVTHFFFYPKRGGTEEEKNVNDVDDCFSFSRCYKQPIEIRLQIGCHPPSEREREKFVDYVFFRDYSHVHTRLTHRWDKD